MKTRRALTITPGYTVTDQVPAELPEPDGSPPPFDGYRVAWPTPEGIWAKGLGALLDSLAPTFDGEGVIVLDGAAANALRLPTGTNAKPVTAGLDEARAAGWLGPKKPGAWMEFYGTDRPRLIVGVSSHPDFYRSSVTHAASHLDTTNRLSLWHDLTGSAWRGSPGIAGLTVLRAKLPELPMKGGKRKPSMKMTEGPDDGAELDIYPDDFQRPQTTRYAHGYDATRMFLAAAGVVELSPWTLRHTGRRVFTKNLAGWWKVELGPWNHAEMPSPAGPGESVRWVTSPTLELLQGLQEAGGPFQPFEVIDSWTANSRRILRTWSKTLEDAYLMCRAVADEADGDKWGRDQDAAAVAQAVKEAYRQTIGLLKPNAGWDHTPTYRADWHYAIIAQARCNLWRKLWTVGQQSGRWPLEITVDNVWYGSDDPDPVSAVPDGLPLVNADGHADRLGTFKPKGTRERGKA